MVKILAMVIILGKNVKAINFLSSLGDSGEGLYMYDTNKNKNILVGIVSYNQGCAR